MYTLKPGIKRNPALRWALPDRVFFGHGACHILAGVFLKYPPMQGFYAEKITPCDNLNGNHIYVTNGEIAFDYHGYSSRHRLLEHHTSCWSRKYLGKWSYTLERVNFNLLNTADLNQRKMLSPSQYFYNPISRAKSFIVKVTHHEAFAKAKLTSI